MFGKKYDIPRRGARRLSNDAQNITACCRMQLQRGITGAPYYFR